MNTNNVIQWLTKYNKYRFSFVLESFLFSSNFENETDVIFLTCNGLSNAKEVLTNSIIEKVLGVTFLSEILNWTNKRITGYFLTSNIITNCRTLFLHLLQETLQI